MRYAGLSLLAGLLVAQPYYNHPTTGRQGTFAGDCQVHTCSGIYYDDGGDGDDYSNNINWIYWTFCPNNSTQCLRMEFRSFDVERGCSRTRIGCSTNPCCYDILRVQDGPAQDSPIIWEGCGTTNPGPFTSSDPSGCLTLRFCSDGSITRPGWAATISCVDCTREPAGNSDCEEASPVCSNGDISDVSYGPGTSPQCGGCITNESYTNFYIFRPKGTSGDIGLSMCPRNGTDDYDFAIWGPFSTNDLNVLCAGLGAPVRCSYSMYPNDGPCGATTACTGMATGNNDVSEDVCGNGWVAPLNVTAGRYYILMINGWTVGAQGYNLTWNLPPGMTLDCTPLSQPIARLSAQAIAGRGILLSWDVDPDRIPQGQRLAGFGVERTVDEGQTWTTLAILPASMSSYIDPQPVLGVNGYRLRYQYEDGSHEVYVKPAWVEWHSSYGTPFRAWWRTDQDALHIEIFDNGLGGAVEVYTVDGRLLKTIAIEPNPFLTAVGIPELPAGTYLVRYGDITQAVVVPRAN